MDPLTDDPPYQVITNYILLGLYTVEMLLKIFALGFIFTKRAYLRDLWNILDFAIVVTGYIPIIFQSGNVNLKALRTLRVLRPLRTISKVKSLRNLVSTLIRALPLILNALTILFFIIIVFAIAGLQLFAGLLKRRCFDPTTGIIWMNEAGNDMICGSRSCPMGYVCGKTTHNPDDNFSNFDTFPNAFLMVFQIITLGGWSTVMHEVMDSFTPAVVIYFLLVIFTAVYLLMNILLGVICAVFEEVRNEKRRCKRA